jgi:2-oxoisovalerate dehydrogenase E1 component alpha subunit
MAWSRQRTATRARPAWHIELGLDADAVRAMYRTMLLARTLDERMWALNRQGKAPFVISCRGQEAAQVGSAWALRPRYDWVLPYYRDVGVVLVLGMTPTDILLGVFARATDPNSGARQMPNHWSSVPLRILSRSSPVATQVPHAAGVALASKIRGEDAVTACYFGEGATSKGDFHEGLNFAAIHRLPVVFVCENNGYAISVPQHKQMAVPSVAARAAAYGIPGVSVDGNDPLAVYAAMREAVNRARRGEGPTLIEAKTYRLVPHSSDDDDRTYRSREEVEAWRQRDPIPRFRRYLEEHALLDAAADQALRASIAAEVDRATDEAEQAPPPAPHTALEHVFARP